MALIKRIGSLEYNPEEHSPSPIGHCPTPLEFDRFIPWILAGADALETAIVIRIIIDDDPSKKFKQSFSHLGAPRDRTTTKGSKGSNSSLRTNAGTYTSNPEMATAISAFYTTSGHLTEVAFIKCEMPVPKIVLDAVHLCLPYHPQLNRITWNGDYLTSAVVSEISNMVIDSSLTEVVLDNSCAPENNYYILLDSGRLKYLSLRGCGVNDETCEKIAERIQRNRPGENLVTLNLAVNLITDKGAKALGHALRTNRRLLFLDLCCNSITGDGVAHILLPLKKFPLNSDEILEVKKKRWEFAKKKKPNKASTNEYLGDITNLDKGGKKKKKTFKNVNVSKGRDQTEKTTNTEGMGFGDDIFMSNLVVSSRVLFSLGNLTLCSLNLAYNQLDLMAVSKIADVLSYQYCEDKGPKSGLMRVVIEGNPLPKDSPKLNLIDRYIQLALNALPSEFPEKEIKEIFGKKKG